MASLVLGVAGAAIGNAILPGIGGQVGWLVGSAIGASFEPPQKQEGPRIDDLKVMAGEYGGMIPIVYGTDRLAGRDMWETDFVEHKHTSSTGGKGGGGGVEVTNYTYTKAFAMAVCEGPDASIVRVWADQRVIYDVNKGINELPFTWYDGSETQLPDPSMEAELGAGNVPAFRGIAYAVWGADTDLGKYSNRIPNLTFEVTRVPTEPGIREVKFRNDLPMAFGGSDSFYGHGDVPKILSWPMSGSDPIAVQITSAVAFSGYFGHVGTATFDRQTLDVVSAELGSAGTFYYDSPETGVIQYYSGYDTVYTAPEWGYPYIGYFQLSDVERAPIWIGQNMTVADRSGLTGDLIYGTPLITTTRPYYDGAASFVRGDIDLAYEWGLPAGLLITGAVLSQDEKCLLILGCSSPTQSGTPNGNPQTPTWHGNTDVWYKVMAGEVVASGTVTPNLALTAWGNSGAGGSAAGSMENNYEWVWMIPTTDNTARIYHIDGAGNLALDPATTTGSATYWAPNSPAGYNMDRTSGTYTNGVEHFDREGIPDTATDATPSGPWAVESDTSGIKYVSILCTAADGYCGVVSHSHIQLLRRVSQDTAGVPLADIVADLSDRVQLEASQYDVTELTDIVHGYQIANQGPARTLIETLQPAYYFDSAETDARIVYKKRGRAPAMEVDDLDLAAAEDGRDFPALIKRVRGQESDLPQRIDVVYIDFEADYQTGTQESQRMIGGSVNAITLNIPIAIDAKKGKQIADAQLFSSWLARDTGSISLTRKYATLDPADVVMVRDRAMRITEKKETHGNVIELSLVADHPAVWTQAAVPVARKGFESVEPDPAQMTDLLMLDIPYITDPARQQIYYAAMAGHDRPVWAGAGLYKSVDSGVSYSQIAVDSSPPDVMGTASTVLADWTGGNVFDEMHSVTVVIGAGGGELESVTREAVLNGTNEFLVGDEIIRAKYCVLTAPSTYVLSGLLRGRHGTEWATGTHVAGERFVALPVATSMDAIFGEYNAVRKYKAVTVGNTLASALTQDFTNTGTALKPYSPVQFYGGRNASGDVTLTWRRRARVNNTWMESTDIALDEFEEAYQIRLYADGTYAATVFELIANSTVLTAAFGGPRQITFTVAELTDYYGSPPGVGGVYGGVAQRGALGAGYEARGAT